MSVELLVANGSQGSAPLPTNFVTRDDLVTWLQSVQGQQNGNSFFRLMEDLSEAGPVTVTGVGYGSKALTTSRPATRAALESTATLTGAGPVDLTVSKMRLNAASGAFPLTLGNGSYDGQQIAIVFVAVGSTATFTATLTNLDGFGTLRFDNTYRAALLKWDATAAKWFYLGGTAYLA